MTAKPRRSILSFTCTLIGSLHAVVGTVAALIVFTADDRSSGVHRAAVPIAVLAGTWGMALFYYVVAELLALLSSIATHTATLAAATFADAEVRPPVVDAPKYACPSCKVRISTVQPGINTCQKCGVDFMAE